MLTRRLVVFCAFVALAGCALQDQAAPPLAGPSELGLSLTMTATPDVLTQDGVSQATIDVMARDAMGQPAAGVTMRAQTAIGGVAVDYGTLSTKTVTTNGEGRVTFTYRAPHAGTVGDTTVAVTVLPVGSNFANTVPREVAIHLLRPGTILPQPPGSITLEPAFTFSPTTPAETDDVYFDASSSTSGLGGIASFSWNFGDGASGSGMFVTHKYSIGGSYNVTLTITAQSGVSATTASEIVVAASTGPTADFVFSPTNPAPGATVFFNAEGSEANVGHRITSYTWDFGDGNLGSGARVNHVYPTIGTYTVLLRVRDEEGRYSVVAKTLTVGEEPEEEEED